MANSKSTHKMLAFRLQNNPYFCVFKYGRAVKQNVWNEAENIERDWGETLKSVKKSVKRGVRVLRAQSARASHARRVCEAREKKPTVRFPYNEFVPTRGFKNVVELSKICSQLRPLCEFDTLGD